MRASRDWFERLYGIYHKRERVHPDPLEFLYGYPDGRDREIVALVAATLAFGRVGQILKAVGNVLDRIGAGPREFVEEAGQADRESAFETFRYRFVTGAEMASLFRALREVLRECGSLNACFLEGFPGDSETVMPALDPFAARLARHGGTGFLLPLPGRKSACKRLNLFLRWMVRKDDVDPGGWEGVSPDRLLVPLDTHMHRLCRRLGITARKDGSMTTALEITRFFRGLAPGDPVRYDFALTRFGMGLSAADNGGEGSFSPREMNRRRIGNG